MDADYHLTAHFALGELWCPCCHSAHLGNLRQLCLKAEVARSYFGPMEVCSAYRCRMHNLEVDGARFSRHMDGKAMDVKVLTDGDRFRLVDAALKAGFRRIGIGQRFVHLDIDASAVPVMWTYYQ